MSYPPNKKLFIGNIKSLDIKILMNTVKLIDKRALFFPNDEKTFGFIHSSDEVLCDQIYEKLMNSMYNDRSIIVQRPKGYVPPAPPAPVVHAPAPAPAPAPVVRAPPVVHAPAATVIYAPAPPVVLTNSIAWMKIDPMAVRREQLLARQRAIAEADRVKMLASSLEDNYAYDREIYQMVSSMTEPDDVRVDSMFAPIVPPIVPQRRVIYNPEEEDY